MIHPTAVIHPHAVIDPTAEIGPLAVIDGDVVLGPGCRVGPGVHLTGHTTFGAGNVFHAGCVIGDAPQDLKYRGEPTRLQVGDHNTFREHVTVHRSNKPEEATVIGSHNLLMAHCHVGHNSLLGDHIIVVNGALLAGHVTVADRVFISGNCMIHQFVRIGTLALMQGGSGLSKDLPPFCLAKGNNRMAGLNVVGLRRAGHAPDARLALKAAYHRLFRSGGRFKEALERARAEITDQPAVTAMLDFIAASTRGVCADVRRRKVVDDGE